MKIETINLCINTLSSCTISVQDPNAATTLATVQSALADLAQEKDAISAAQTE